MKLKQSKTKQNKKGLLSLSYCTVVTRFKEQPQKIYVLPKFVRNSTKAFCTGDYNLLFSL